MEFDQVLAQRKSIRSFTKEPVSQEDIDTLFQAAQTAALGKHNDKGYMFLAVTNPEILALIDKEATEKLKTPHMFFQAPALLFICETPKAYNHLKGYDAGIIAEHIHLKATEMGLGSVILFGFIHHLGHEADYIKALHLPEGVYPMLGVAVGHSPVAHAIRKEDRHFEVRKLQ